MFTGLVEEVGSVRSLRTDRGGRRITIECATVLEDLKVDDSIALNGVCQTVVALGTNSFDVEAVPETLKKTTLAALAIAGRVNLERAMALGDRLGGHMVQGHVDATGTIVAIQEQGNSHILRLRFPLEFARYVIPVGSICIDGISLTVAEVEANLISIAIIPHTWQCTTLRYAQVGMQVNLEFDLIGKYIEKMLMSPSPASAAHSSPGMTREWLKKFGH